MVTTIEGIAYLSELMRRLAQVPMPATERGQYSYECARRAVRSGCGALGQHRVKRAERGVLRRREQLAIHMIRLPRRGEESVTALAR